jgi:hypothetical protein
MSTRSGSCLCGSVQYEISAEPVTARLCWCRSCQKLAGNGTANALFPTDSISATGALSCYTATADSGNQISRYFCPTCGSHLFASSTGRPQFRVVRLGTLDDPSSVRPQVNIWASSAPRWACLDPTLEVDARQPVSAPQPPTPSHP